MHKICTCLRHTYVTIRVFEAVIRDTRVLAGKAKSASQACSLRAGTCIVSQALEERLQEQVLSEARRAAEAAQQQRVSSNKAASTSQPASDHSKAGDTKSGRPVCMTVDAASTHIEIQLCPKPVVHNFWHKTKVPSLKFCKRLGLCGKRHLWCSSNSSAPVTAVQRSSSLLCVHQCVKHKVCSCCMANMGIWLEVHVLFVLVYPGRQLSFAVTAMVKNCQTQAL